MSLESDLIDIDRILAVINKYQSPKEQSDQEESVIRAEYPVPPLSLQSLTDIFPVRERSDSKNTYRPSDALTKLSGACAQPTSPPTRLRFAKPRPWSNTASGSWKRYTSSLSCPLQIWWSHWVILLRVPCLFLQSTSCC